MGKVVLYLALTLDGYIADLNEGYAFLEPYGDPDVYDFDKFMARIGGIIMGRVSYQQIMSQTDVWPYKDYITYVYTRNKTLNDPNVTFTQEDPRLVIQEIKAKTNKDIWLFGGGEVIDQFIKLNLVDEYILNYVPEVLSEGIPLFRREILKKLEIVSHKTYGQILEVILKPKK